MFFFFINAVFVLPPLSVPPVLQDREELFAYEINWQMVETHNIIQSKMRPWIVKKIIEYLGEEEKTLTEFILTKLGQRATPQVCVCASLRACVRASTKWCSAARPWRAFLY